MLLNMSLNMPANLIETAGPVLLLAGLAAAAVARFGLRVRVGAAIAAAMLAIVPFGAQSFVSLALGLLGPVSAATLVMLVTGLICALRGTGRGPTTTMLLALLVIGVVFYPLTLGLTVFDPYEYGYRGLAVPALMLVLAAIGWWRGALDMMCWIALAGLLYVVGAYGSRNLWDYLIFPLDPVVAAVLLAGRAVRALPVKSAAQSPPNG